MEATDFSGSYDVGEVTLRIDGVPITKGDGATGRFVFIGNDGTHFKLKTGADGSGVRSKIHDPTRPFAVTLLRSSKANDLLRSLKKDAAVNTSIIVEHEGGVVLDAKLVMFANNSPKDAGQDEYRWDMTVVG
jgi:hypothetical protein